MYHILSTTVGHLLILWCFFSSSS